jgi:hypothetical protein
MVNIKGYEFKQITVRDSYNRRALQCKNNIITYLTRLGLNEDDIDIPLESNCMKKAQASIAWYMWDQHLFFSYTNSLKYVENLFMVEQVIKHFVNLLITEQIDEEEFINLFKEDMDIAKKRKEAREVLGVHEDSIDFEEMHENYKKLAKEHHPDMPTGDTEMFKKINVAHKILKKELN